MINTIHSSFACTHMYASCMQHLDVALCITLVAGFPLVHCCMEENSLYTLSYIILILCSLLVIYPMQMHACMHCSEYCGSFTSHPSFVPRLSLILRNNSTYDLAAWSRIIHGIIARKEGEPGDEATPPSAMAECNLE